VGFLLGDSDVFRQQKQQKIGGNRMKRPNRYPYTRSQWEEETTLVFFGNDDHIELKVERNKITKEARQCH